MKRMHNAMNIQLPRSPISPLPPQIEIPSMEERVQGYVGSGYFEQYGNIFYSDVDDSSDAPPPPPFYGSGVSSAAAPSYAPPPPPFFGSSSFGSASTSVMASLHESEPHHPSAADIAASRLSDAIFGTPHGGNGNGDGNGDGQGQ